MVFGKAKKKERKEKKTAADGEEHHSLENDRKAYEMYMRRMGIFGESYNSPFDEIIEKVTAEHQSSENWALILDICDKINTDPKHPKLALTAIRKRLNNRDPHVIILSLSVLDSCWSNCGESFRKEVSSASFINELMAKATHSTRQIGEKTRLMIKRWVDNECKSDASLSLVISLYKNLIEEGFSFECSEPKKKPVVSNDPNVVSSEEEEKAIARAIALSLEDSEKKQKSSCYPSMNGSSNGITKAAKQQAAPQLNERTVRALYDFEAAEDNELSFVTGDLITVTDDTNPNWWRGRIGVQQGLFPSSFVTSDLSEVKTEPAKSIPVEKPPAVIDEAVLLKCIQLLEDCDPTGEVPDSPELAQAEAASLSQGSLIDARLAAIDKQSNALAQVDIAIRDVLALYDSAVQQSNPYQNQGYIANMANAQPPPVQHIPAQQPHYVQYPPPPQSTIPAPHGQYNQYQQYYGQTNQQPEYGYQQQY